MAVSCDRSAFDQIKPFSKYCFTSNLWLSVIGWIWDIGKATSLKTTFLRCSDCHQSSAACNHLEKLWKFVQSFARQQRSQNQQWQQCDSPPVIQSGPSDGFHPAREAGAARAARAAYPPGIIVLWCTSSPPVGEHQKPARAHRHQKPASTRGWNAPIIAFARNLPALESFNLKPASTNVLCHVWWSSIS